MQELLTKLIPNVMDRLPTFFEAIGDTLLMVVWSGAISFVLGLALGVLITVTKPGGILENKVAYQILDKVISLFRSIPFIILRAQRRQEVRHHPSSERGAARRGVRAGTQQTDC